MVQSNTIQAVIATPWGELAMVASASHLLCIEINPERLVLPSSMTPLLQDAALQFESYFDDPRWKFSLPLRFDGTPYQQNVWRALSAIPLGSVKSYGLLAEQLHSGPRAVAGACRANRFPIIIPCHRVVARNGLGGYCGAVSEKFASIKRWLLRHEAYEFN